MRAVGNEHDVIQYPTTIKFDNTTSPPLVITEHKLEFIVHNPFKGGRIKITRKLDGTFPAYVCEQVHEPVHQPTVCVRKEDECVIDFVEGQHSYFTSPQPMHFCWQPNSNQNKVSFNKQLSSEVAYNKPDGVNSGVYRDHVDFALESEFV